MHILSVFHIDWYNKKDFKRFVTTQVTFNCCSITFSEDIWLIVNKNNTRFHSVGENSREVIRNQALKR